jgi:molybdenum cofactor biosynthesis protein B
MRGRLGSMRSMPFGADASRGCAIATISDTRTAETDHSGSIAAELLSRAGHVVLQQRIITEETSALRHLMREWTDDERIHVIVTIGGTGLDSTDITPDAVAPLTTKYMPGFGEIFRMLDFEQLGVSALATRAMAAVCHSTLVYLMPSEPRAVKLGIERLIIPQLYEWIPTERLRPTMLPAILGRDSHG